jgi:hypothetical protein
MIGSRSTSDDPISCFLVLRTAVGFNLSCCIASLSLALFTMTFFAVVFVVFLTVESLAFVVVAVRARVALVVGG